MSIPFGNTGENPERPRCVLASASSVVLSLRRLLFLPLDPRRPSLPAKVQRQLLGSATGPRQLLGSERGPWQPLGRTKGRPSWLLVWVVLTALSGGARAADGGEECRWRRQQRDALASAAMEQEIALARTLRGRLCPDLAARAEGANAKDGQYAPIDYGAWSRCRLQAERQLEASRPVRYRNSQGFTFYTSEGATLARQADEHLRDLKERRCL